MSSSEIRKKALENLRGNWLVGVGYVFVSIVASLIVNAFTRQGVAGLVIGQGISLLALPIVVASMNGFFLGLADKTPRKFNFSNYLPLVISGLVYSILLVLSIVIVSLPLVLLVATGSTTPEEYARNFVKFMPLLLILMVVSFTFVSSRFVFIYLIVVDACEGECKLGLLEPISLSWRITSGSAWRVIKLSLSFIGWFFLSLFTCGIGVPFAGTYYQASLAVLYRELQPLDDYSEDEVSPSEYAEEVEDEEGWVE